jgi:general secretion pathway protein G
MRHVRNILQSAIGNRQSAFTLIEIMVVIVILGILATLVVPKFLDYPEKAKRATAHLQINSLKSALGLYKLDVSHYPTAAEGGLEALVKNPGVPNWKTGGYLQDTDSVPKDPWGNPYVYKCPGDNGRDFDIISYGPTGQPGGTGTDAEIDSWISESK